MVTASGGPEFQITWSLSFLGAKYILIVITVALAAAVGTASRKESASIVGSTEVMRLTFIRQFSVPVPAGGLSFSWFSSFRDNTAA
jgi:hypothetical protein